MLMNLLRRQAAPKTIVEEYGVAFINGMLDEIIGLGLVSRVPVLAARSNAVSGEYDMIFLPRRGRILRRTK